MPRKLPPHVTPERRGGKVYLYFRIGKGPRVRLPDNPMTQAFRDAYAATMANYGSPAGSTIKTDPPRSIGALIVSYRNSSDYRSLSDGSKVGYGSRLESMREAHGGKAVGGLTRDRIDQQILAPLADRPGAQLDTLKKLRILIAHAIRLGWLKFDPSAGIKRPRSQEIRAWTDAEMAAFERRWPIGTKQRTAYALMLYMGAARVDAHGATWRQFEDNVARYERTKTGVAVQIGIDEELRAALAKWPRTHVTIITTAYGKLFTVDGFSRFMRDAITDAGLPLSCQPHGLRKTLGRLLADAGATAHEIMAALGHTTLAEADRYTREADRRRGGANAIKKLSDYRANRLAQTAPRRLGKSVKSEGKS